MNPLIIDTVTAVSDLALANEAGKIERPGIRYEIWSATSEVNTWGAGSKHPVALQVPLNRPVRTYDTKFIIQGKCTFPSEYPRVALCKLVGSLDGKTIVFESEAFEVKLKPSPTPPNPPPPELKDIRVEHVATPAPFSDIICSVPFRLAGDFEWKIMEVNKNPLAKDLPAAKTTRLEVCLLRERAPAGLDLIRISAMKTGVNLQGKWPIGLLRLFLPKPSDFSSVKNFGTVYDRWWAAASVKKLQTIPCTFDTIAGKSRFGTCCGGGSFDLDLFVKDVLAARGITTIPMVNSFDLTALLQLASSMLLDGAGYDILDSHWVCKSPFGHLQPSMPFRIDLSHGADVTYPPGVNNPFYRGMDPPASTDANVEEMDLKTKTYICNARSWLEVTFLDHNVKVLDTSALAPMHPLGRPEPDEGTNDRAVFIANHIVDPGFIGDCTDTTHLTGGCYSNNDFSTLQSGQGNAGHPTTSIARVGVYDVSGIGQPRMGPYPAPFTPIPTVMWPDITTAIENGRNPIFPVFRYNNASLKQMNIIPILLNTTPGPRIPDLQPVEPTKGPSSTNVNVTKGAAKVTYIFTSMPVTITEKTGTLVVNINVFDNHNDAYQAMAYELAKYERDVLKFAKRLMVGATTMYMGHYSLQTPHSILCMRDNLFIEMTITGNSRPDTAALDLVTGMMQRLDDWLSRHTVQYSQTRRPSMATTAPVNTNVPHDTTFNVVMQDVDTLADQMRFISSNGRLITSTTPGGQDFDIECLVFPLPDNVPARAVVTVAAADIDTFHPGWMDYDITVTRPANAPTIVSKITDMLPNGTGPN